MRKSPFEPCIPTPATSVPERPEWLHEIKHDGYRLIVQREAERVRLFTRNGHDWSDRYPLIAEAALRLRSNSFVLDGEADFVRAAGGPALRRRSGCCWNGANYATTMVVKSARSTSRCRTGH
jgi:ATP-dependent DNA ligase